jgi:hypothetical protein
VVINASATSGPEALVERHLGFAASATSTVPPGGAFAMSM